MFSLLEIISDIFFPRIAERSFGERCANNALTEAFTMLWGFADPRDLATMSCIPRTSQTALIGPPAIIPVPAGADLNKTFPDPLLPLTS